MFGDKWGIEILLCAFFRLRRFSDFRLCTGIAANILTDRLDRFVAIGVLTRADPARPQAGYRLTERGVDLYGVMVAVEGWADRWLPGRYASPVRLIHRACGQRFRPSSGCAVCDRPLRLADIDFAPSTGMVGRDGPAPHISTKSLP